MKTYYVVKKDVFVADGNSLEYNLRRLKLEKEKAGLQSCLFSSFQTQLRRLKLELLVN